MKYKQRASAADALEKLAGKQLKDFPNQAVSCCCFLCLWNCSSLPSYKIAM